MDLQQVEHQEDNGTERYEFHGIARHHAQRLGCALGTSVELTGLLETLIEDLLSAKQQNILDAAKPLLHQVETFCLSESNDSAVGHQLLPDDTVEYKIRQEKDEDPGNCHQGIEDEHRNDHENRHHQLGIHLHQGREDALGNAIAFLGNLVGKVAAAAACMEQPRLLHVATVEANADFGPDLMPVE